MNTIVELDRFSEEYTVHSSSPDRIVSIPGYVENVAVRAIPAAGSTCMVQTSMDDPAFFLKGNEAELTNVYWVDWPLGEVGAVKDDMMMTLVSALRLQLLSGTSARFQLTGYLKQGYKHKRR